MMTVQGVQGQKDEGYRYQGDIGIVIQYRIVWYKESMVVQIRWENGATAAARIAMVSIFLLHHTQAGYVFQHCSQLAYSS